MITLRSLFTSGLARVSEQDGEFRTRQQDARRGIGGHGKDIPELRNVKTLLRERIERSLVRAKAARARKQRRFSLLDRSNLAPIEFLRQYSVQRFVIRVPRDGIGSCSRMARYTSVSIIDNNPRVYRISCTFAEN